MNVNLKYSKSNTTTNEIDNTKKEHEMVIVVGNDEIKRTFTEGTEKMTETISGKGTVEVRVKIDGSTEGYQSMNFDNDNPVLNFDVTVR